MDNLGCKATRATLAEVVTNADRTSQQATGGGHRDQDQAIQDSDGSMLATDLACVTSGRRWSDEALADHRAGGFSTDFELELFPSLLARRHLDGSRRAC